MDIVTDSQTTVTVSDLYKIDELGKLTPTEKEAISEFFRIATVIGASEEQEKLKLLPDSGVIVKRFVEYINNSTEGVLVYTKDNTDIASRRLSLRAILLKVLRAITKQFLKNGDPVDLLIQASEEYGRFRGKIAAAEEAAEVITILVEADGFATDITVEAAGAGLTDAQQRLLVDVEKALTVVSVVTTRNQRSTGRRWPFSPWTPSSRPSVALQGLATQQGSLRPTPWFDCEIRTA
jgi:hypothetical protein